MNTKKYILKPGKHQFAPGSPAVHDNDNLNDNEAAWYLERYPHIASLFESTPQAPNPAVEKVKRKRINQIQSVQNKDRTNQFI
jgi:hypothetical protein